MNGEMRHLWRTFWADEGAQDLVEYAYLAALIGLAGTLIWVAIVNTLGIKYTDYDNGVQGQWVPPNP